MRRQATIFAVAILLAGCGRSIETRITSSGIDAPAPSAYMISTTEEASTELRSAYRLVAADMARKGFTLAKEAPLHLEITLDARPATLAVGADRPGSLSAGKKRKPLQSCDDREYRVGLTLTRVADGAEIYRGRSAEYHCKASLAAVMPALVRASLGDIGNPRGTYVVKRIGQE